MRANKKMKKNKPSFTEKQMSRWNVMVVIKYFLELHYDFNDFIFIPNLSYGHELALIHKISCKNGKVTIFLNSFIFPYEMYSTILDNDYTTEYALLQAMLKLESVLLKKRYELLFIESVGNKINLTTDTLLARVTDFFPNSPLVLSDKINQLLRSYGYVYSRLNRNIEIQNIDSNELSDKSFLGLIELGNTRKINVKKLQVKLFLREEFSDKNFCWIEERILEDFAQWLDLENNIIKISVELYRHPFEPFILGVNILNNEKIYAPSLLVEACEEYN